MKGTIISKTINNRDIYIYLPKEYNNSNKSYPVIYIHDGDEILKHENEFFGKLERKNIEFVGILITHIDRNAELSPWYSEPLHNHKEDFQGKGDDYLSFISKVIKPFVDENYSTKGDTKNTYILGASLGGLISLYSLYRYGDIFGNCISISGSFWYKNMLSFMAKEDVELKNKKIFISVGAKEGKNNEFNGMMKESNLKAYEILKIKGIKDNIHIKVTDCTKHSFKCFIPMFILGIEWVFNKNKDNNN